MVRSIEVSHIRLHSFLLLLQVRADLRSTLINYSLSCDKAPKDRLEQFVYLFERERPIQDCDIARDTCCRRWSVDWQFSIHVSRDASLRLTEKLGEAKLCSSEQVLGCVRSPLLCNCLKEAGLYRAQNRSTYRF